jgi:hypothetical protein
MTRQVTEQDFRMPEFRDAKVEDYEFRADGKLVRKDRWQQGIYRIVSAVGMSVREFEIDDVVERVEQLVTRRKSKLPAWPNGCDDMVPKALRYLAHNDRPSGGEQHFNHAHLLQLADEIELMAQKLRGDA